MNILSYKAMVRKWGEKRHIDPLDYMLILLFV